MKTTIHPSSNLMNRSRVRAFVLIPFALACFALAPQARAVCQQGCDLANSNTFLGDDALVNNTTGIVNTAIGADALLLNTTGTWNTANGANALANNTNGDNNTAIGVEALYSNTAGRDNTATGEGALSINKTGSSNTAIGMNALGNNITGNNIAVGESAGVNLTTGSGNIDIGNIGVAAEARIIRIGTAGTQRKTFIAGISGATVASGVGVIVGSDGQLGTVVSSERFKDEIKAMGEASEAILALKPVTFRYKHELDPDGIPQFGLVAEQVEKVNPDLVGRDEQGKPYTVRYEAVNAMLLNEFLKEHRKVEEQEVTITQLRAELQATATRQQEQIDTLTAGLQKVSAQLEASKPEQQMLAKSESH
jgi:hypothetical protein